MLKIHLMRYLPCVWNIYIRYFNIIFIFIVYGRGRGNVCHNIYVDTENNLKRLVLLFPLCEFCGGFVKPSGLVAGTYIYCYCVIALVLCKPISYGQDGDEFSECNFSKVKLEPMLKSTDTICRTIEQTLILSFHLLFRENSKSQCISFLRITSS